MTNSLEVVAEKLLDAKRLETTTICSCGDRKVVIFGNGVLQNTARIWCMDWDAGEREDVLVSALERLPDEEQVDWSVVKAKAADWARQGSSHAAWWLGWVYEGANHPKSIWYYMAALRRSPAEHGWALSRIHQDAHTGALCPGVPKPCLAFLSEIPEFNGAKRYGDWKEAISRAETAVHIAATPDA